MAEKQASLLDCLEFIRPPARPQRAIVKVGWDFAVPPVFFELVEEQHWMIWLRDWR